VFPAAEAEPVTFDATDVSGGLFAAHKTTYHTSTLQHLSDRHMQLFDELLRCPLAKYITTG